MTQPPNIPTPTPNPVPPPVLDYHTPTVEPAGVRTRLIVLLIILSVEVLSLALLILWICWKADATCVVVSLLAVFAFLTIQSGIVAPVIRPRPGAAPQKSPWYWLSAIALGLMLGFVVLSAIFLAVDWYWATHREFSDSDRNQAALLALVMAAASWLADIPLIMAFMKRGRPDSTLAKLAAALFLGSAVEVIASLPIMDLARRRDSCTCSNLSFLSILISIAAGAIVLGPMIFLLIFARRTRAPSRGRCPVCSFDLRQLANRDRCPRCGTGWKLPRNP